MKGRIILEVKHRGKWKLSRRGPELEFQDAEIMAVFWGCIQGEIKRMTIPPHVRRVRCGRE